MNRLKRALIYLLIIGLCVLQLPFQSSVSAADGLIAAYSFNEGSGSSFADKTGNGHTGNLSGGASFDSTGKYGGSVYFDGTNGMGSVSDANDLDLTNGMTLEAWVRPSTISGWKSVILKENSGNLAYALYGNTDTDRPSGEIKTNIQSGDTRGSSKLAADTWTHLAATYDGTALKLYVNGSFTSQKNMTGDIKTSGNSLRIGGNAVWGENFKGYIDDVRIYNKALTENEIQIDMNTEVGGSGPMSTPTPTSGPMSTPTPTPTTGTQVTPTPTIDPRSQTGQWGTPMTWPLVAVHTSLLPNGKVLTWDGWEIPSYPRVWDPQTNSFSQQTVASGLFCSAHSHLADGNLLVVGGYQQNGDGIVDTNLFDASNQSWSRLKDMKYQRWYPTTMTLSDGRILALSGMIATDVWADTPEIFNPQNNTWEVLNSINTSNMHDTEYPYIFPKTDGSFYVVSPDTGTLHNLSLSPQSWTSAGTSPIRYGSLSAYAPGKVLMTGGGDTEGGTSGKKAAVIDLNQANPSWRTVASMQYGRYMHSLVTLPDGTVFVVGGSSTVNKNDTNGALAAELWNPQTETWKTLPSMRDPRMYHSTAMVMPDGRVLVAGGGRYGSANNYFTAEYYSPGYLFKGNRPTIQSAPGTAYYNSSMTVTSPDAASVSRVTIMSISSVTHTVDMDQRFTDLSFTKNGNNIVIDTPTNLYMYPPGYYIVFILSNTGVPSVGKIFKMENTAPQPTAVPTPPQSTSPIAAYNFNQTSGSTVSDRTGNNHTGTVNGTATYSTSGKYDGAITLNGTNNYISIDDANDLDLTNAMTLEAWVNPSTLSNWRNIITKEKTGGLVYGLYANTDVNKPSVEVNTTVTHLDSQGTSQLPTNTWTFVTGTYDGSVLRLYINGTQVAQKNVSGNLQVSSGKLRIGGNAIWGEYFKGMIDNVRIYNRVLSANEIQTDMNTPIQ